MPIVDAYGEGKFQRVTEETFGHLRAKPGQVFPGFMIFALDLYGDTTVLAHEFPELEDSPWEYQDTFDYADRVIEKAGHPRGGVFRFDGVYKVSPTGRRRYVGKVRRVRDLGRLTAARKR